MPTPLTVEKNFIGLRVDSIASVLLDYKIPIENISFASVVISPEIPIENIASILEANNIPVEIQSDVVLITTDKNIPIEVISQIISNNDIPVEVFRDIDGDSIWSLNKRGILWGMSERQIIWNIENFGVLWVREDK
jgi:hypothetical protein